MTRNARVVQVVCGVVLAACGFLSRVPAQGVKVPLVAGSVTENGAKVAGASVHVVWVSHPELPGSFVWAVDPMPERRVRGKTKANGRFRIALPEDASYAVYAERGTRRSPLIFPVRPGAFLDLELLPKPVLQGNVRNRNGQPVAGAKVARVTFGDVSRSKERYRYPAVTDTAVTDVRGVFRLPVFPDDLASGAGRNSLRAWTADEVSVDRFYIVGGQTKGRFDLTLTRPRMISGTVLGNGPLVGARVFDADTGEAVESAVDGSFRMRSDTGALVVSVGDYAHRRFRGDEDGRVNVQMQQGLKLLVELRRKGKPWAGKRVVFGSPIGGQAHTPWVVKTDSEGRCVALGLKARMPLCGFAEVEGKFQQFLSTVVGKNGPRRVFDLRSREIRGRVVGLERQPLVGVRVLLQPDLEGVKLSPRMSPAPRLTYTDRGGRFRFTGVMQGPHRIAANGGADGCVEVSIPASLRTDEAGAKPLVVSMKKGMVVTGRALMPDGTPAMQARIQYILMGASWLGEETIHVRTRTDAQGRFRLRGMPKHRSFTCYCMHGVKGTGYWGMTSGVPSKAAIEIRLAEHPGRFR